MEFVIDNDDLLTEILLRLPAKTLIRFKSVRKKWLSLISSDRFCHQHTLRRPKLQPSLIINTETPDQMKLFYSNQSINGGKLTPYHMSSIFKHHRIIQACNGLLLLESFNHEEKLLIFYSDRPRSYYVYNPVTRKSREIILPENPDYRHVAAVTLAFDPSKSPYYKIVCISLATSLERSYNYHIEVFDSESHSWKVGLEEFKSPNLVISSYDGDGDGGGGVYWNNCIYWKMINKSAYYMFDIDKIEMETISFPQNYSDPIISYFESYLQESNGRLYHLLKIRDYHYRFDLESALARWESESVALWELRRDDDDDDDDDDHYRMHSPWRFKYRHSLGVNSAGTNPLILTVRSDEDEDEDETCSLLIHRDGKVRAYSFLDKTYQDLFYSQTQPSVFQFGETLALV